METETDKKEINIKDDYAEFKEEDIEEDYAEFDDTTDTDISVAEVQNTENDSSLKNVQIGAEWSNIDQVPVKKIKCYIPKKLYDSIREIECGVNKKFGQKNEFSIFIHGEFDEEGDLVVSDKFYIPKQVVGPASVDYKEEPESYYNGCLHKHPDGCNNFSGTDDKYINSNFEFSLLYVNKEIRLGIINIKYFENRRVQVSLDTYTEGFSTCDIDISKITKFTPNFKNTRTPSDIKTPGLILPGKTKKDQQLILPSFYNTNPHNDDIDESDFEMDSTQGYDPLAFPF